MKKYLLLALFFIGTTVLNAEIVKSRYKITASTEEFDINYIETPDMKRIDVKENPDVAVTRAYSIKKGKYEGELRYSLFTDTGGERNDAKAQAYIWSLMCLYNICGYDAPKGTLTAYGDADVKGEFNGSYGFNAYVKDPVSKYGEGYKYLYVDFFCREGQGLVIRTFLFTDAGFTGVNPDGTVRSDSALFSNFHSFSFFD